MTTTITTTKTELGLDNVNLDFRCVVELEPAYVRQFSRTRCSFNLRCRSLPGVAWPVFRQLENKKKGRGMMFHLYA